MSSYGYGAMLGPVEGVAANSLLTNFSDVWIHHIPQSKSQKPGTPCFVSRRPGFLGTRDAIRSASAKENAGRTVSPDSLNTAPL
jgi:hypothetical protein